MSRNLRQCALALLLCSSMSAYAQGEPEKTESEKFAVYVSGASDAGINKSFGNKLISAIAQSGKYAEIGNPEAFYDGLAKDYNGDINQIIQTAKLHGADVVCVVGMTELFGAYSISAKLVKTADSWLIKTALLDRSLKSLDDLTIVSNELAGQLLQLQVPPAPSVSPLAPSVLPPPPPVLAPAAAPAAPAKECASKFSINELVSKIQSGFPTQLKDCSATLAKDIAMSKSPFGKKTELKEPKAFMTECTIDGIKQKLPSGADEYVKPVESFIQNILNAASAAGGGLDVKKLSGAIGGMNVMDLINELKTKAANDECVTNEPYVPPVELGNTDGGGGSSDEKGSKSILSLGFRGGLNMSHLHIAYDGGGGDYNSAIGWQLGLVFDIATSSLLHFQPGVMYIRKGAEDDKGDIGLSYIELPLLLSLKLSAFRLNAGPYFGICVNESSSYIDDVKIDMGINAGLGFDIGMFYIGVFYGYGLIDLSDRRNLGNLEFYNRTLGFNLGVNL